MDIRAKIKQEVRSRGMILDDLAAGMKITRQALFSRLKDPKFSTLEEVARVLGVGVEDLFVEHEDDTAAGLVCPHCGKPIRIVAKK